MEAPCVRVDRERGEEARRALAARDLIVDDLEITVEDDRLYIPVTDPDAVPEEYDVVSHDAPVRDTQEMPADLLAFEPSYERLGDIAILHEDDPDHAREIAEAIVASALPVKTVVNRASEIKGERRVRDWDVLVGDDTETVHREYGFEYALDISLVYFSPRLATERRRVTAQIDAGERVFDMFAGVGPFVIPAAARDAEAVGVDVNEHAIRYLRENAKRNGVDDRITAIADDVRAVAPDYEGWADRVIMNLPHSAGEFLDEATTIAGDRCVLHYYDIQHEDDPFGPGEQAIRSAASEYDVTIREHHEVRSYAPHELNVCLDAVLER